MTTASPAVRVLVTALAAALLLAGSVTSLAQPSQDLAEKAQRAQAAMAGGRFDDATRLYTELVEAVPGEAGLRLNLGMALGMAGRPREAIPHLEVALESGRPELVTPAAFFLGAAHMELGQPDRAVGPLETFVEAQPDNPDARHMLGEALLAGGRHEAAAHQYRALTDREPKDPRAWYGLGRSYEGLSQQGFQELQTVAPESAEILLLVADLMVSEERDKRAFQLYREALEKDPGRADAHVALAAIYERDGHPDWAAAERAKAAELPTPDCSVAPLECDFRSGRYADVVRAARGLETAAGRYWLSRAAGELARGAFAHLEDLDPSPEATLIRVQILRAQRRYSESKEALEAAVRAWPDDIRIRQELGTLLFIASEYEEARPVLEDLLRREPGSPQLNLLLGELWVEQRQPEKGVPYLEKAVAAAPDFLRARAVLGRAYVDAGEAAKAIPHLEAALETDEDGSLRFQLARAYQATGQRERARQIREEFQEIRRTGRAEAGGEDDELAITPP